MEIKKCVRCGSFFVTDGEVCGNCVPKDKLDIFKLKNYFEENSNSSVETISINTGISTRNVERYLKGDNFPNIVL